MEKDYKYYSNFRKKNRVRINKNNVRYKEYKDFKKKYGFRIEETWNLNYELILWFLPRLAFLRDNHISIPTTLCELDENGKVTNEDEAAAKWKEIINSILEGFEIYIDKMFDLEKSTKEKEKIDLAFKNFKLYFDDFWD